MSAAAGREEEWDASSDGEDQQAPKRRTREKTPMPGSDDSESDWRQRPKSPTSTARRGKRRGDASFATSERIRVRSDIPRALLYRLWGL